MEENLISVCSSNVQTALVRFLWRDCCKAAGRCSYLASRRSQKSSGYATRLFIGFPLSANHQQYSERDRQRGRQRADSQQGSWSMTIQLLELKLAMTQLRERWDRKIMGNRTCISHMSSTFRERVNEPLGNGF